MQCTFLLGTHEDERGIEVSVVLYYVIAVKLLTFLAINGEEDAAGTVGPQQSEELIQGGVDIVLVRVWFQAVDPRTYQAGSTWTSSGTSFFDSACGGEEYNAYDDAKLWMCESSAPAIWR